MGKILQLWLSNGVRLLRIWGVVLEFDPTFPTLQDKVWHLEQELARVRAEKQVMRDSVVEHMAHEESLREAIRSMDRTLEATVDERNRLRAKKRQ